MLARRVLGASILLFSQSAFAVDLANVTAAFAGTNATTVLIEYIPSYFYLNHSNSNATLQTVRQRISYIVRDGVAIIEGDVSIGSEAEVLEAVVPEDQGPAKAKRSLSIFPANPLSNLRKWPNGRFEYKWADEASRAKRRAGFEAAIKLWTDRVPSIQFVEVSTPNNVLTAGGPITVLSVDSSISSSPAGRSMNPLGTAFSSEGNVLRLGNCFTLASCASLYAHELGHSLGLRHEHKRPDFGDYITLNCANIQDEESEDAAGNIVLTPPLCAAGVGCAGHGCQFSPVDPLEWDWSGPYDTKSIMHYEPELFQRAPGLIVLEAKPGIVIDPAEAPTPIDARRVCDIYWEVCRGVCGDGVLSPNNDEECDDGNNDDGDGCSADCKKEPAVCGNGVLERGEECDDGNLVTGDGCTSTCSIEFCGDGIVSPVIGEECDEGSDNGDPGIDCDINCKRPCLAQCDPTAGKNLCHPTTSCIRLDEAVGLNAGHYMCACAHGFRASGIGASDVTKQIRTPGPQWPSQADRVFVQPGVACGQVCDQWTLGRDPCEEVLERPQCF